MTFTLARRNLTHDRVRLFVTLTGVIFAVVLIAVQMGLFVGFTKAITDVIDHSTADVWVASHGLQNFDVAASLHAGMLHQVLAVPGVDQAERLIVDFSNWRKPSGGEEFVEVIGYDMYTGMSAPWNVVEGNLSSLSASNTVFVDQTDLAKLGIRGVGDEVEISGQRARVVGLTKGIRSFTTSPYVFTSLKNALNYCRMGEGQATYILAKAETGVTPAELKARIAGQIVDVDVYTTKELSKKTEHYWMFSTGAGLALLIAAALGLIVGTVIVAQTLYATTMDHLPEFGTLRAMGAPNSYIYRIIIGQAIMSGVAGYGFGLGISLGIIHFADLGGASIILPWPLAAALFFLTIGMCVGASFVSIQKVTWIDPAMVFKGA